ncbi:DUF4192 domain-containing protein [Nocardia sp. NPDC050697]|uniref:DUF4192 domain-containing protein n=1 Tax=Nocardia sp. NPDC050697 TaxID=3155158 RepID=UPI0033EA968C
MRNLRGPAGAAADPARTRPAGAAPAVVGADSARPRPAGAGSAARPHRTGPPRGPRTASHCGDGDEPPFDAPTVYLGEPGALLASMPAMVGFPPERSLVIVVLRAPGGGPPVPRGTARVDAVVRFDLETERGAALPADAVAECVADLQGPGPVEQIVAVVVDERGQPERGSALVAELAEHLGAAGLVLGAAYSLPGFTAGAPWRNLLDPAAAGTLPDPADSPVAFGHVLSGLPLRGSRTELTDMVAAAPELAAAVERELEVVAAATRADYADAVRRGAPVEYSRRTAEFVLWQVSVLESGAEPQPRELARIAVALRDRPVRDIMFALAAGPHAGAAERLWLLLTRALTGADRAEAAALLGYSAYLRGDGPFAGIALDVALDALPGHPMAVLLETSLRSGMRPARLRRLVLCGYESATDLGLDLGPRR